MNISTKIMATTVAALVFLGTILTVLAYKDMMKEKDILLGDLKEASYDARKKELKNEMRIIHHIVKGVYERKQKAGASKEETINSIKSILQDVRFFDDKSGYIFIFDYSGKNVLMPIKKSLEGQNIINSKDENGKYFLKELIQEAKQGGGIVQYMWPKAGSDKAELKFSYALSFEPYNWMMGTGVYVDNIEKEIAVIEKETENKTAEQIAVFIFTNIAIILLSIGVIYAFVKKSVTSPLEDLIDRTDNLSQGDGDLTRKLKVIGDDEIARASASINTFIEKVRVLIADAKSLSTENSSIAHELSTTALEVERVVEESTTIVNKTTQQATQTKDDMHEGVDEAKESKKDLEQANSFLASANSAILNLTEEIRISASTEIEIAGKIQQLSQDTEQVKDVLQVIGDIADQTNLLALNAAIEAARAGEHGRGFAVVADEVRKLAERTQKSLVEINATINVIVQAIMDSSEQMTSNSKKVEELSGTASSVEEKIRELANVMEAATNMADKTVTGYIDTGSEITNMIDDVSKINELSTQNARSVEEIASAAEHMNKMTEVLNNKLAEFKT